MGLKRLEDDLRGKERLEVAKIGLHSRKEET